jgi:alkanesulfonate monooxygenase SsuD/methylene tetrahydromethanopterin reductase-like flavin-dependent oxidoreductase (luciferase family)
VEALGYGSIWTFDHLLPFSGAVDGPCFETLTTLGALAVATSRVRLGALVNGVVYRHPAVLAKAAAQVDRMSEGRFEFSLGAGWAANEFRTFGLEFPSLTERYARLDEAMQLVKLLWREPRSTFHGHYYHLDAAPCEPKPVQWPHPPITVGGTGQGALRVAAMHADRLNVIASPQRCAEIIKLLESMRQEMALTCDDIEFSIHTTLGLAMTREAGESYANRVAASHGVELATLRDTWLIGDPAAVTARLRQYLDVGISHFIFALGYPFDLTPLRLFQEEVLPALA